MLAAAALSGCCCIAATPADTVASSETAPVPVVGQGAPQFSAVDSNGYTHRSSDYAGKIVVLEWTNAECPYTRKHYSSDNRQSLQRLARQNDIRRERHAVATPS
jgi:hypothetical protein